MRNVLLLCFVLAVTWRLAAAGESIPETGQNLVLTVNLLSAPAGSWVRRTAPRGHAYTTYVAANDEDSVTLHLIHSHHERVERTNVFQPKKDSIRDRGLNPYGPNARDASVTRDGRTYRTRAVPGRINDSDGLYHFADGVPATGILCVEVYATGGGNPSFTLWNDASGLEPDRIIQKALDGEGVTREDS